MVLVISKEEYLKAYNSPLFLNDIKSLPPKNFEYIPWHKFEVGIKKLFPNYSIEYEINPENNSCLFYIDNKCDFRDRLEKEIEYYKNLLKNLKESNSKPDYKEVKALENKINEYQPMYLYNTRGAYILSYILDLTTGEKSTSTLYPIQDNLNNTVFNLDARDLNDQLARAMVKCGSRILGYALRLFTREDLGKDVWDEGIKAKYLSMLLDYSNQYYEKTGEVANDLEDISFITPTFKILELGKKYKEIINK